ncbi:YfiR family protein [Caulobacter segnis]|uniref:YfiR family protein n=1 Tax=Caulobacter segnis TaxID=88688 RepID=UPI00286049C2|nr:YfiR family protein [Caulobacter segnis]MDR6626827.1 hypothetical protein [Caulobacter segnis]
MVSGIPPSGPRLTREGRFQSRRFGAAAGIALCLIAAAARAQEGGHETHERHQPHGSNAVKASHLVKFPAFVAWPDGAFEAPDSPFRLCIGGRDPFGPIIDRLASAGRVGDHPMTVARLPVVPKAADCHLLFVSVARGQAPREMLAAVAGRPVLTVVDEGLDVSGAMIQFVTVAGRARFEISADAAQAEGLTVSSKLLSLSAPRAGADR